MSEQLMQYRVSDLYMRYSETLSDLDIVSWPEFFTDDCMYRVISRPNYERGRLISAMFAESKGALRDRVAAIQETMVYSARSLAHMVSGARVVSIDGAELRTRSSLVVYQTLVDGITQLQLVGRTFDVVDARSSDLKFKERLVVFDTELLAGALVYPV
ncbi:MAG: aromatic-ring-hydroxylating dioxygenase subunit beta [Pusillimonas sp.]|nr:aromatic-ring-hydroxylating dioxygenase subunit beta [Pusillimonas sp.]